MKRQLWNGNIVRIQNLSDFQKSDLHRRLYRLVYSRFGLKSLVFVHYNLNFFSPVVAKTPLSQAYFYILAWWDNIGQKVTSIWRTKTSNPPILEIGKFYQYLPLLPSLVARSFKIGHTQKSDSIAVPFSKSIFLYRLKEGWKNL